MLTNQSARGERVPVRLPLFDRRFRAALVISIALPLLIAAPDGLHAIAHTMRGVGPPTDFIQDIVGARALVERRDAYPVLVEGAAELGVSWPVADHRSTHPPSAFLLALPVAWLSWEAATARWVAAMAALLVLGWLALGLGRWSLLATAATLLWPPAAWSLFQLTPIWFLGIALAWRFRGSPLVAGIGIGLASLTKLVPAVLLLPFLGRRQWLALVGFTCVWISALFTITSLGSLDAVGRYVELIGQVGQAQAGRNDNAALLVAAWIHGRWIGFTLAMGILATVGRQLAAQLRVGTRLSFADFGVWVWLATGLLPIAWDYSMLPLLPWLVVAALDGLPLAAILAGAALILPLVPWGNGGSILITLALGAAGLALTLHARAVTHAGVWETTTGSSESPLPTCLLGPHGGFAGVDHEV